MKERRRWGPRPPRARQRSFWCAIFVFLCCVLLSALTFSTFRLFGVSFRPVLISPWQSSELKSISDNDPFSQQPPQGLPIQIQEAVLLPDRVLLFLKSPSKQSITTSTSLLCLYFPDSSPNPKLQLPSVSTSSLQSNSVAVRCPLAPQGSSISLSTSPKSHFPPVVPRNWNHLVYAAVLDRDNSTIVFAKGLNLRPARLSDAYGYECVFGWDFLEPKYLLSSAVILAAQEVFRCQTPPSVLLRASMDLHADKPLVSIRTKGRGSITLPSIAHPENLRRFIKKKHNMCVCTMLRNQARFLKEWVIYHSHIGVERWFIYDNNSDDGIEQVIGEMGPEFNSKIIIHTWPWIKTQEAGFAHCAIRARESCEWVGFIDVDEFLYLASNITLHDMLSNYSASASVGELRSQCHTFGPSGSKTHPSKGVTIGYTCRMVSPERHKSIVRLEALNPSLINIVHHFHLKNGWEYVNIDRRLMVINHYKYQVWEVFKEKFYRRVATYVADWQDEENVGSKDRAPGLGTKAVEPADWPSRFCEVNDTGLRDWVLKVFVNPSTGLLPW